MNETPSSTTNQVIPLVNPSFKMDFYHQVPNTQKPPTRSLSALERFLVKMMNFWILFAGPNSRRSRRSNFRLGNMYDDAFLFADQISSGQFSKIYGRITNRYNYHVLQKYDNSIRRFDVKDPLATAMASSGNSVFYQTIGAPNNSGASFNFPVDLTKIDKISSIRSSADYLYNQVSQQKGPEAALQARTSYIRGYSRPIRADDFTDWEALRTELRKSKHVGAEFEDPDPDDVLLFAISYKAKEVKLTRRMRLLNADGSDAERKGILFQESQELTSDFVNDFRWSQVVRSCMTVAKIRGASRVRIWIDRLVMMGYSKEEKKRIYDIVSWEDIGLFPYAVCPVVRVYEEGEVYFGTDFWRKLEAVMGVAGKGLILDDYMLRKYDRTIFYGPSIYSRLSNGISVIGGDGIYIRTVTLAMATAMLTDGVSVSQANEDFRTKREITGWKAWALRTIAEGAYSSKHSAILRKEEAFPITLRNFKMIAFWESMVSRSEHLTGKSYMDMSYQRSMSWRKSSCWDGINEWVGMLPDSCIIQEREMILAFLNDRTIVELYVGTTGHVASSLLLQSMDALDKRQLVVNLSRFSTARSGHVTAVAEATGLWLGTILPWYLRFSCNPDRDQIVEISDNGVEFKYNQTVIEFIWYPMMKCVLGVVFLLIFPIILMVSLPVLIPFGTPLVIILWMWIALKTLLYFRPWPWVDSCDVGEALFDNLLLHGLYGTGVKKQYRKLRAVPYSEIGWTGLDVAEKAIQRRTECGTVVQ